MGTTHTVNGQIENNLVLNACRGDRKAFGRLAVILNSRLLRIAWGVVRNRDDAKEVVQSVYLEVLENIRNFDPGNGNKAMQRFSTYIKGLAWYRAIDCIRRRGRFPATVYDDLYNVISPLVGPADHAEAGELLEKLFACRSRLTPAMVETLDGLLGIDADASDRCSPCTWNTRVFRLREFLRAMLADYFHNNTSLASSI